MFLDVLLLFSESIHHLQRRLCFRFLRRSNFVHDKMTIVAAIPVTIKSSSSIFHNNGEKQSENIFKHNNAQFFQNKTVSLKNFCPGGERSANVWTCSSQPHWNVRHVVWPVHPKTNICFQHFLPATSNVCRIV